MEAKIALNTPKNTVASIPALLGFKPKDSVVVLFMADNILRLTARQDDVVLDRGEQLSEFIFGLCDEHEFTSFLIVNFGTKESDFRRIAGDIDTLCDDESANRPAMIDAIHVWPDGTFISTISPEAETDRVTDRDRESNALAAARVINGDDIAESREDIVNEISMGDGSSDEYASALESAAKLAPDVIADYRWKAYDFAVSVFDSAEPDVKDLMVLVVMSSTDVKLRDAFIRRMAELKDTRPLRSHLVHAARLMPERDAPVIMTMIGVASFLSGDGLRASIAFDKALEVQSDYVLADLMSRSVNASISPDVWRELLLSVPLEKTLGV
jgi:hypothetical protein